LENGGTRGPKRLKDKQAKRKEIRAEQNKKLAAEKKQEEDRVKKEAADRKAAEDEMKKQEMLEAERRCPSQKRRLRRR
jgi:troponin T